MGMTETQEHAPAKTWHPLLSLVGYKIAFLPGDLAAGLTLAAIAIPEQMATARLGGFPPGLGFTAFLAGAFAFAVFGANRFLSTGADSTITPIFASGLALLAASGSPDHAALAAALALMVGVFLIGGGAFRLGWIADLLSIPVTTGFLAGIAIHIIMSQLPTLLGLPSPEGGPLRKAAHLFLSMGGANPWTLGIGVSVFAITVAAEKVDKRLPGPLIAVALATLVPIFLGADSHGITVLGAVPLGLAMPALPEIGIGDLRNLFPTALVVTAVIMVQTAATTRSFEEADANVNRDFIGVGAGNMLAGLLGAFPVNASPPRTAIVAETGGRSQIASLTAAALVLTLLLFGASILDRVPQAALSGILLFIAVRIIRIGVIADVFRATIEEFVLIIATLIAIVVLPIGSGVACGIALSLLHGMWSNSRVRAIEFSRVAGTSIWWAPGGEGGGEHLPGILVLAWQAPLSFLNAYAFQGDVNRLLGGRPEPLHLLVLESSNMITIDFTAAKILGQVITDCRARGIDVAIARLESLRAQQALANFGLTKRLGTDHVFQSVAQAVAVLGKTS
jgi:MFS superfamily sulfate permease-like transporter